MKKYPELDWNNKRLEHWLKGRGPNTASAYKVAMSAYIKFRKLNVKEGPEILIQEKWDDIQKKKFEQGVVEDHIREFNKWLIQKEGLAASSALAKCSAIASFYRRHNMPLSIKLTDEFSGAAKGVNESEKLSPEQVEKIAYYVPTKRDKAIVWTMFQGGFDISTVCSLNWGHIEKEIRHPPKGAVMIRKVVRAKGSRSRSVQYDTFFYKTAINHIRDYLREQYGEQYWDNPELEYSTPLFLSRTGNRMEPRWFQETMRKIIPDVGIAKKRAKEADINPIRPHALRASFSEQLIKAGANKTLIDYWMGHKIKFDKAYFRGEEGLRDIYVKYAEDYLEPKGMSEDVDKELGTVRDDLDKLKAENYDLQEKMNGLTSQLKESDERFDRLSKFVRKWVEDAYTEWEVKEDERDPTKGISKEDLDEIFGE